MIGSLYVVPHGTDICVELLLVRHHPEDTSLILVVPCDDSPLVGSVDVPLGLDRPLTARCGCSQWVEAQALIGAKSVGAVSPDSNRAVRNKLADLARGRAGGSLPTDSDPEYEDLIGKLLGVMAELATE